MNITDNAWAFLHDSLVDEFKRYQELAINYDSPGGREDLDTYGDFGKIIAFYAGLLIDDQDTAAERDELVAEMTERFEKLKAENGL